MRCTVLLFAQLAESTGRSQFAIDLPEGAKVADALELLSHEHGIGPWRDQVAVAVNERLERPGKRLRDGDTIALIPPVSGG